MSTLAVKIIVLSGQSSLHATWATNAQEAEQELWHYAVMAIAGNY